MTAPALAELDSLNARLWTYPLPDSLRLSLEADQEVTQTYNSNAIEGNTLTLAETKAVLLDGATVSGHPLREDLEAVNHKEAWRLMRRMSAAPGPLFEGPTKIRGLEVQEADCLLVGSVHGVQ